MIDPCGIPEIQNREHALALVDQVLRSGDDSVLTPFIAHHMDLPLMEVLGIMSGSGHRLEPFEEFLLCACRLNFITLAESNVLGARYIDLCRGVKH
ncbi:MAG: hypothetical protein LBR29_08750 [Methylobacteriaceae bacterium]|jgi:hypothetical protein|nr:hypothetical protein [Methylobacteriaceae bacterium]